LSSARPELAIIDIRTPPAHGTEGLQAARVIRAELPSMAIIVLSAHAGVKQAILPPGPKASDQGRPLLAAGS
jgi:DNA-binding NarL/FixJ family response regulator